MSSTQSWPGKTRGTATEQVLERQNVEGLGQAVVETLAGDLQREFPGVGGFSASNLWRMKAFHEAYRASEKLAPLMREIAWSHNLIILERCSDHLERELYLHMTRKYGSIVVHSRGPRTA